MESESELRRRVEEQARALESVSTALRQVEQMLAVEMDSAQRLQRIATQLINARGVEALYDEILDTMVAILHADFATIQMFYPERGTNGELRLLGHRGFSAEAARRWEWISMATRTTCGEALRIGGRVAVSDVRNCGFMAGTEELDCYLDAGIHAAQTLPLVSRSGGLLGMVSTYWREPHELSVSELRALDVLARLAADLIERSRVDDQLRESEERLRFAQEAAGIGSFDWNIETAVNTWTAKLESLYGLPPGRFPGTQAAWESLVHPEDLGRTLQRVSESFETGQPTKGQWRVIWPDGSIHWLTGRWRVLKNAAGEPVRMLGVNIDVTDSKQKEVDLRQSEERLRLALRATNDGIWDVDLASGLVSWNEQYSELFGRPTETSNSWQWWIDHIHPEDRDRVAGDLRAAIAGTASNWHSEYRFGKRGGGWAYIYDRAYIARDANGKAWRVVGAMQDLTERKQAEEKVLSAERRFREMADAAPVMIWVSGVDKMCTFFNKGWLAYRGRSMERELGEGWTEGVHHNDMARCMETYSSAFDARRSFQMEYRLCRADGEYRWILDNGAPMFTPSGVFEGYIGSCIDIHELKRSQEENLDRQKLESIGVLAAGVAHDFNNLLGGILAEVQLVEDGLPPRSNVAEEVLRIKNLATRASEIVRQLMAYAGRETAEFEMVDLSGLVENMVELLKISIAKPIVLKMDLSKNLPLVRGQISQIRQLVMNLVTNASEAIGDREGVISVATSMVSGNGDSFRTAAAEPQQDEYVRLEVSDTGRGMTEEEISKIFDPFFSTKFAGRGLGLAVVQGVVRGHGGTIRVDSVPGRGTDFQIFLPGSRQVPEPVTGRPEIATPVERVSGSMRTVLLVEDEDILRQAVGKMLRRRGFLVIEAADGSTAIESVRNRRRGIDVILLDLTIPGADSGQVVHAAQQLRPETRIVLMTAYSRDAVLQFSRVPQVTGYIRKPFRIDELTDLLVKTTLR